jgi:DNA polymerase-1
MAKINWDSPAQVKAVLKKVGVRLPDTRTETLYRLRNTHPIVAALLEYRKACEKVAAYPDLPDYKSPVTGRVHPTWDSLSSPTGRITCSAPNLQAIPRDDPALSCIKPDPGNVFTSGYYAQPEVRVAADLSGDPNLMSIFQQGLDVHCWFASQFSSHAIEDITREERQRAKAVSLQALYGLGPDAVQVQAGLRYDVDLSSAEVKEMLHQWRMSFPRLHRWQQEQRGQTSARTKLGRLRTWTQAPKLPEILTYLLQTNVSDGMKLALIELMDTQSPELVGCGPNIVYPEELVVEGPLDKREQTAAWVQNAMETGMRRVIQQVPVVVEVKAYINLAEELSEPSLK